MRGEVTQYATSGAVLVARVDVATMYTYCVAGPPSGACWGTLTAKNFITNPHPLHNICTNFVVEHHHRLLRAATTT